MGVCVDRVETTVEPSCRVLFLRFVVKVAGDDSSHNDEQGHDSATRVDQN